MKPCFDGKTVLVTGAGWGIGAAIALRYAAYGAKVVVSDTSRKGGKDIVDRIKSQKGAATYIRTDVSNVAACEKLIKSTIETYGSIDIACNNSSVFGELMRLTKEEMEAFDMEVSLSTIGLNNCMQAEIKAMQKHGGGIIVNTSSIIGAIGLASLRRYLIAKYGMTSLPQNPSGEYPAGKGIHINTVAPAFINTALSKATVQKEKEDRTKSLPEGRSGIIQEVAGLILWLSSAESHLLPTVPDHNN